MAKSVKTEDKESCRIITDEFRVSYPHVFKPAAMRNSEPKYSIVMLFKKTQDLSTLKLAIKHAKIAEFGPDKDEWPDDLQSPVVDGDHPKYADKEGYKGHWAIKASSNANSKPGVVDEHVKPIVDQTLFYPGCYARAQIFARVWEYMGKQGVHFILDHVQKTKEGSAFGGRKSVEEVFTPLASNSDDSDEESDDGDFDFR